MLRKRIPNTLLYLTGIALLVAFQPRVAAATDIQSRWTDIERIVVVGDVHGAYQELVGLLKITGVVDESLAWSGGATHLVSLGDLLDRGPESRAAMDLLMRLRTEAAAAGGQVHVVLGNHEHMNLIGDLRYVSVDEYAAFAADETGAPREQAREQFDAANAAMTPEQRRAAFDKRHPPGYFAHRAAFRPDGHYGRWLLSLPVMVVLNDTAFVHGGLPAVTSGWTAGQLNEAFSRDLRRYLELWRELVALGVLTDDEPANGESAITDEIVSDPSSCIEARALSCEKLNGDIPTVLPLIEKFQRASFATVNTTDSPFWYRGSVYCRDLLERPVLDRYLATLGAQRVVVGHTVTNDRRMRIIRDGKLVMADTGMLVRYYKGKAAALVIEDGELRVHYLASGETEPPAPGPGPVAFKLDAAELVEALERAPVTTVDKSGDAASWRVTLDHAGSNIEARFFPGGRRGSAEDELAAAALDELLGTELVPPTVARTVEGTNGALQLAFPGEITEQQRLDAGRAFGGWCPMDAQLQLMNAFDLLIANAGRTAANILYGQSDWTLRLSDHGRAFGKSGRLPRSLGDDALELPPGLVESLQRLNRKALEAALGERLDSAQIKALLSRRDALLKKFAD